MSWNNPAHPGYPYPEIGGLMLSYLAMYVPERADLRERITDWVASTLTSSTGVTRHSTEYVFDSAMVLSGLLASKPSGDSSRSELQTRLFSFISDRLTDRQGIIGASDDPDHWSSSYGCHLLKTALAIAAYADGLSDVEQRRASTLLDQLATDLLPLQVAGRFRMHERSQRTYLHSHCYATEGLLCLRDRGFGGFDVAIEESAAWLASVQSQDGGIRAWHDGEEASGAIHSDASAQAVRIWDLVDRDRYAPQIQAGLGMLRSLTDDRGGLRYQPGSDDINTWATIFAWQAGQWSTADGDAQELI
jgi:hypothetical protein